MARAAGSRRVCFDYSMFRKRAIRRLRDANNSSSAIATKRDALQSAGQCAEILHLAAPSARRVNQSVAGHE